MSEGISHILTNEAIPRTEATVTVRVIKSFEYRTQRSLVLHKLNLETTTVGGLKEIVRQAILTGPAWRPYRNAVLDTLKLYTKAHGAKTTNLIINLDHDDWILEDDDKTLVDVGFGKRTIESLHRSVNRLLSPENETEVSFFGREAYEGFKLSPEVRWDATS